MIVVHLPRKNCCVQSDGLCSLTFHDHGFLVVINALQFVCEPSKGWSASKLPCAKPWWPCERWPGGQKLGRPPEILHFSTQTHLRGDHQTCPTNHPAAFASDRKDTNALEPQDCLFDSESESRQQWDDMIDIYFIVFCELNKTGGLHCFSNFSIHVPQIPSIFICEFLWFLCVHNFTAPSAWTGCNARGSPAWEKWLECADKTKRFGNHSIGTCVRTTLSMFLCKSCYEIMGRCTHHASCKEYQKSNGNWLWPTFFSPPMDWNLCGAPPQWPHGSETKTTETTTTSHSELWMSPKSSKEPSILQIYLFLSYTEQMAGAPKGKAPPGKPGKGWRPWGICWTWQSFAFQLSSSSFATALGSAKGQPLTPMPKQLKRITDIRLAFMCFHVFSCHMGHTSKQPHASCIQASESQEKYQAHGENSKIVFWNVETYLDSWCYTCRQSRPKAPLYISSVWNVLWDGLQLSRKALAAKDLGLSSLRGRMTYWAQFSELAWRSMVIYDPIDIFYVLWNSEGSTNPCPKFITNIFKLVILEGWHRRPGHFSDLNPCRN